MRAQAQRQPRTSFPALSAISASGDSAMPFAHRSRKRECQIMTFINGVVVGDMSYTHVMQHLQSADSGMHNGVRLPCWCHPAVIAVTMPHCYCFTCINCLQAARSPDHNNFAGLWHPPLLWCRMQAGALPAKQRKVAQPGWRSPLAQPVTNATLSHPLQQHFVGCD